MAEDLRGEAKGRECCKAEMISALRRRATSAGFEGDSIRADRQRENERVKLEID